MLSKEIKEDIIFLFKKENNFSILMCDLYFEIVRYINKVGDVPFKKSKHIKDEFVFLISLYEETIRERNENLKTIKAITGKDYGTIKSELTEIFH